MPASDEIADEQVIPIAAALGRPVPLAFVPVALLKLGARLAGKSAEIGRLAGSLEVDASSFATATGWRPEHPLAEELARLARSRPA